MMKTTECIKQEHGSGLGIKEEGYLDITEEGMMGILNEGGSFAGEFNG